MSKKRLSLIIKIESSVNEEWAGANQHQRNLGGPLRLVPNHLGAQEDIRK